MYCNNCMNFIADDAEFCTECGSRKNTENIIHHLRAGTVLNGKYLVGSAIGEGGFGITYIGRDLTLNIRIAIKEFFPNGYATRNNTISNEVSINYSNKGEYFKQGMDKFLMEAQNIAKFSAERGIVDVRDYFTENNTAYIIMEYLDGITLSDKIKRDGVFSAGRTFSLMLPVMHSLENMHRAQILHRDISPDNIMLLRDGSLKLMDFGSARYFTEEGSKTMSIMLKPGYAPYEQYNSSGHQGPWTDVYGLCATIYKCITGVTPKDSLDRCRVDSLDLPSRLGADISQPLENVLMYGLAVYPENRCRSMQELISITQQALGNQTFSAPYRGANNAAYKMPQTNNSEQYKTVFADGSEFTNDYSDGYRVDNYNKNNNFNAPNNAQFSAPVKKKKSGLFISLIISLSVVLALSVGAVLFILYNQNNSDDAGSTDSQTVSDEKSADDSQDTSEETVTMVNVEGMSLSGAKTTLGKLGLKVKVKYEQSDTVTENYIISQQTSAGTELNKGDEVTVYSSIGTYAQRVYVEPTSGSDANLYVKVLNDNSGQWEQKMFCKAKISSSGLSTKYGENNNYTPKGDFNLGYVLYGSQTPETNMNVRYISSNDVLCTDYNNYPDYYNTFVDKSLLSKDSYDSSITEYLNNSTCNQLIVIETNGDCFSEAKELGKGSGITICGGYHSSSEGTGGCIDISQDSMTKLLGILDASKNPHIYIGVK